MGLPLFHAPVESDIASKSASRNPADPANTRSPIRRAERRRQLLETRTHRLHLLHALQSGGNDGNEGTTTERERERERVQSEPRPRQPEVMRSSDGATIDHARRYDLWNSIDHDMGDDGSLSQWEDSLARWEEREARRAGHPLQTTALPGPEGLIAGESYMRSDYLRPDGTMDLDSRLWSDHRRSASREGSVPHRSRDLPYIPGRLRPPVLHRQSSYESAAASRSSRARNPDPGEYLNEYRRRRNLPDAAPRMRPRRLGRYVRYMDGLGDRERSPEDDSAWDTLQSSITPDPQPPSVGSSFASTTVSGAASQVTASSTNTSVTTPIEEVEPPCDPVDPADLNAESDDDEDREVEDMRVQPSRRPTPHGGRRSYADVTADLLPAAEDDGMDRLEWLSQMQHIVSGLASRQDIPDQWWASVGLTRSMTQE
ncbi:hypothetical protein BKA67DRAFT_536645 [Truncatella angustata]|uniref:Uncharacterized protein n=1 Tax=Truncatella angustata TaxID=152316 RepID=A0A9P8UIW0_9PEZI|nr:uncharacterized protein BKA67DRAFT_536645 [Truncatella angustata]KAH6652941.1 hypothetical protein BKA67DRAFT_536645 [Truncatella angustata]KAH8198551.1 hypothetical protein TruAng_007283 [Truncatella angustata]